MNISHFENSLTVAESIQLNSWRVVSLLPAADSYTNYEANLQLH